MTTEKRPSPGPLILVSTRITFFFTVLFDMRENACLLAAFGVPLTMNGTSTVTHVFHSFHEHMQKCAVLHAFIGCVDVNTA